MTEPQDEARWKDGVHGVIHRQENDATWIHADAAYLNRLEQDKALLLAALEVILDAVLLPERRARSGFLDAAIERASQTISRVKVDAATGAAEPGGTLTRGES